jgi:TRAP-type uncharacterized transport system fused permease subunit
VAGYFNSKLNVPMRLLLLVAALCLISPEVISSVIGIVLGVAVLALNTISAKKVATA